MNTNNLMAGHATIDITPPTGYWMGGYGSRKKPSQSIHDPLFLKIITLFDRHKRIAIITADLVSFSNTFCTRVKKAIIQNTDVPESGILLTSSHTHTGPLINDSFSYLPDKRYFSEEYRIHLIEQICNGINTAIQNEEQVVANYAKGNASIGINRRKVNATGIVEMAPNPEGPVDHDVQVITFKRNDGSPHSILFKACCHPNVLGPSYEISADYPGVARREVEKAFPGVTAAFINGCAGDIRPNIQDDDNQFTPGTFDDVEKIGKTLAKEVINCCHAAKSLKSTSLKSKLVTHTLKFDPTLIPKNNDDVDYLKNLVATNTPDLKPYTKPWADTIKQKLNDNIPLPKGFDFNFTLINIGDLTLAALPGEVMVEYGLKIKQKAPDRKIVVAAYCNEDIDYIPTKQAIIEGGYEAYGGFIYDKHPAPYAPEIEEDLIRIVLQS